MSTDQGKWQLAFWVINIVCGAWLLAITSSIISNDRLRACEDQRIEAAFSTKLDVIQKDITDIKVTLARMVGSRTTS